MNMQCILKCRSCALSWQIIFVNCERFTFLILQYSEMSWLALSCTVNFVAATSESLSLSTNLHLYCTTAAVLLLQILLLEKFSDDLWWWWLIKLMWLWVTGLLTEQKLQCKKVYNKPLVFHLNTIGMKL